MATAENWLAYNQLLRDHGFKDTAELDRMEVGIRAKLAELAPTITRLKSEREQRRARERADRALLKG